MEGELSHEHNREANALAEIQTPEQFMEYFRTNYPGPNTIICSPDWHAPKIYRAAISASAHNELLENLKDMVRRFEGWSITNGTDKEFAREATAHARAAIAKATGGVQ